MSGGNNGVVRRKALAEREAPVTAGYDEREAMPGKTGVLLLNLGGPDSLEDVQPFLYVCMLT